MLERLMLERIRNMTAPNAYLEKLKALNSGVIDWHTGASGIKDIMKHPTIGGKLAPFQLAMQDRDIGQIGRGIGSSKGFAKAGQHSNAMALERQYNRQLGAAGLLEEGLRNELSSAQGNLGSVIGQDYARMAGSDNLLAGLHGIVSSRIKPGFWSSLGKGLLANAPSLIGAI